MRAGARQASASADAGALATRAGCWGNWGTTPGQNFIYVHLNRVIKEYDLDMIYVAGPGHGGPAVVGNGLALEQVSQPGDGRRGAADPAYPWLIHRLTCRRTNHDNSHVRGYKEEGTITTPFDMTVLNDLDRFHLVMDTIDRYARAAGPLFAQHGRKLDGFDLRDCAPTH